MIGSSQKMKDDDTSFPHSSQCMPRSELGTEGVSIFPGLHEFTIEGKNVIKYQELCRTTEPWPSLSLKECGGKGAER